MNQARPSFRWPAGTILAFLGLFCGAKLYFGDMHWPHLAFAALIFGLYFAHLKSRELFAIIFPVMLYAALYDFLRYVPFDWLRPIRVLEPFQIDQHYFGVLWQGRLVSLHSLLYQALARPFFDVFTALVYTAHMPMVLLLLIQLWRLRTAAVAQRMAWAFLLMNLLAFATYLLYPAAPPWYVERYGFGQPLGPVLGDAAGLKAFDQMMGLRLFTDSYAMGAVTFGAIPSMHIGYAAMVWLYSGYFGRRVFAAMGLYPLLMSFSALYLQHHYFLDVVIGFAYAGFAFFVVEKGLKLPMTRFNRRTWEYFVQKAPPSVLNS